MNIGSETKLKFWVQVADGGNWITMPGFSGGNWREVRKAAQKLHDLNQEVRILREVTKSTIDVLDILG